MVLLGALCLSTLKMSADGRNFERIDQKVTTPPKRTLVLRSVTAYWQMLQFRIKLVWVSFGLFMTLQALSTIASYLSDGAAGLGGLALVFAFCVAGGVCVGSRLVGTGDTDIVRHDRLLSWIPPLAMKIQSSYTPQPWTMNGDLGQYKNIPEDVLLVAQEVREFISSILRDFIHSWYREFISEDENFPADVFALLEDVFGGIILRLSCVRLDRLLQTLFPEFQKHLVIMEKSKHNLKKLKKRKASQESRNLVACYETFSILHPAAMSLELELDYIRSAFGMVMDHILPEQVKACEPGVLLVREIVCQAVLVNAVDLISDPDFINHIIVLLALCAGSPANVPQEQQQSDQSQDSIEPTLQHTDQSETISENGNSMWEQPANGALYLPSSDSEQPPLQHTGHTQHLDGKGSTIQVEAYQLSLQKVRKSSQEQQVKADGSTLNPKESCVEINHNNILDVKTEVAASNVKIPSISSEPTPCNHFSLGHHPPELSDLSPSSSCTNRGAQDSINAPVDLTLGSRASHPAVLGPSSGVPGGGDDLPTGSCHLTSSEGALPKTDVEEVLLHQNGLLPAGVASENTPAADGNKIVENYTESSLIPLQNESGDGNSNELEHKSSGAARESERTSKKSHGRSSHPRSPKRFTFSGFSSFMPVPLRRSRSTATSALSKSVDSVADPEAAPEDIAGTRAERGRNKSVPELFAIPNDRHVQPGSPTQPGDRGLDSRDEEDGVVWTVDGGDVLSDDQRFISDLKITSTEQVQEPNNKRVYIVYTIEFRIKTSREQKEGDSSAVVELQVKRRYREFLTLHWKLEHQPELKKSLKGVKYIPRRFTLPIMKTDMSGVEQRRRLLEKYLKQLLDIPTIHASQEIVDFLALNGNGHIAFVRNAASYTPNFDKILRNSLSGVKQGLKILTPFPSSRSEVKPEKMKAHSLPVTEKEDEHLNSTRLQILRVCSLMPGDSKFCLKDIMPYVIRDTLSRQGSSSIEPLGRETGGGGSSSCMDVHDSTDVSPSGGSGEPDLWLYTCIMDTLSIMQKEHGHWLFEENVQLLLRNLFGDFMQRFVQREIWTLLSPRSWALYLSLIRDVIWPDGALFESSGGSLSQEEKEELHRKAEDILLNSHPNLLNVIFGKTQLQGGVSQLFESVQNQHLNKHLIYTFFDHLLDQALPELNERTGDVTH